MQVEKAHAPATAVVAGRQVWFCSDHCKARFADRHSPGISPATRNEERGDHAH
jgi:YHS domain-containing protein